MVFDFETCNLNLVSKDNKPWQLAFMIYEGDKLIESNDYFIHWDDLKMSDGARKVTGFKEFESAQRTLAGIETVGII